MIRDIIDFTKWMCDIRNWDWFSRRLLAYALVGIGGSFFTPYSWVLIWVLFLLDFSWEILQNYWRDWKENVRKN